MKRRIFYSDEELGVCPFPYDQIDTREQQAIRQAQLRSMRKAIQGELTPRQLECVHLYYDRNLHIVDISRLLNVNPSTVSRHLKKARARLGKVMAYYCY